MHLNALRCTCNLNSDIKIRISVIKSILCDCSVAYIHVKTTLMVENIAAAAAPVNNTCKKIIIKNCAPFTNCISETINTQVDDAQDIDIVISMYDLIEYSNVYLKILGNLWQYYRDEPALNNNNNVIDFPANNSNSISFKFKQQITDLKCL